MFNYSYSLKILFYKINKISELILKILYYKYKTIIYIYIDIYINIYTSYLYTMYIRYTCYHELFLLLIIMIALQ